MRYLLFFILIVILSCNSKSKELEKYFKIVDSTDEIKYYSLSKSGFQLTKDIQSSGWLNSQKDILKRNIKQEYEHEFIPRNKIEIYNHKALIGTLLISNEGFITFKTADFSFCFHETYGIGMSL